MVWLSQTLRFFARGGKIIRASFWLIWSREEAGPVRLRCYFERLGGAFLKLGQVLALRYDFLPPAYTVELLNLLSRVRVLPFAEMRPVFRREAGADPETVFKSFEEKPIASASISQVYRAVLPDGAVVAVKLKRPETDKLFEVDLLIATVFGKFLSLFSFFRSLKLREAIDDFVIWTRRELDFRLEAKNAIALRGRLTGREGVVIPQIYEPLVARDLLVSEFIDNMFSVDEIIRDPERFATTLDLPEMSYRFAVDLMRQYLIDGLFHADPHPANIFFLPDGQLGYFDFGLVGEAGEERLHLLNIIYGIAEQDLSVSSRHFLGFTKSSLRRELELFREREKETYEHYLKVMEKIEEIIIDNLRLDLERILAPWYSTESGIERPSTSTVFAKITLLARNGVELPPAAGIFFRTVVIMDMVALRLNPGFVMLEAFRRFFREYPIYRAEELVREKLLAREKALPVDPLTKLSFEQILELKQNEAERLLLSKERLGDLVMSYAEKYEEVRKLLR